MTKTRLFIIHFIKETYKEYEKKKKKKKKKNIMYTDCMR